MVVGGVAQGFVLAARPESARAARGKLRAWLESASWPTSLIDDIVCAVNEAVANVAEHAYRPDDTIQTVELRFRVEHGFDGSRRARVQVSDQGRWLPPRGASGCRGFGLVLMRALLDEVIIRDGEGRRGGTVVELLSRPASAPAR